jgi:hypothetical protein
MQKSMVAILILTVAVLLLAGCAPGTTLVLAQHWSNPLDCRQVGREFCRPNTLRAIVGAEDEPCSLVHPVEHCQRLTTQDVEVQPSAQPSPVTSGGQPPVTSAGRGKQGGCSLVHNVGGC